jgi:hypothetical protein
VPSTPHTPTEQWANPVVSPDEAPPADCTASIVTVTVYTPRDHFVDHEIATHDVRAVLRAALDRDFPRIESIRISSGTPTG